MRGGSSALTVAVIVVILAIIGGVLIYTGKGGGKPVSTGATTTSSTTSNSTGQVTSYNKPVKVVKQLNITIGEAPNVIKISKFAITVYTSSGSVQVDMILPNPCYNANLRYEPSNQSIFLIVKPPSQGTMCVQVVKPVSLTTQLTPPPSGQVYFIVIVGDHVEARVPINLPS